MVMIMIVFAGAGDGGSMSMSVSMSIHLLLLLLNVYHCRGVFAARHCSLSLFLFSVSFLTRGGGVSWLLPVSSHPSWLGSFSFLSLCTAAAMQALQLPSLLNRLAGNGAFTDEARTTCERAFFFLGCVCCGSFFRLSCIVVVQSVSPLLYFPSDS